MGDDGCAVETSTTKLSRCCECIYSWVNCFNDFLPFRVQYTANVSILSKLMTVFCRFAYKKSTIFFFRLSPLSLQLCLPHAFFFFAFSVMKSITSLLNWITSAAGFPPTDTHSNSISRSSVVTRKSPCKMRGGSGGTNTVSVANLDRMPGWPEIFI